MSDKVILGIHSQVDPNTQGSFNQFVDGHAWISVTRNGQTQYYGLWPDNHPRGLDNGDGSDIRRGIEGESGFRPSASRYYELTAEQAAKLQDELGKNVKWEYTHTCASWASEVTSRVTGQKIEASEFLVIETPRELINGINALESKQATSLTDPITPTEVREQTRSSSSLSQAEPAQPAVNAAQAAHSITIADAQHPQHFLYQQADKALGGQAAHLSPEERQRTVAAIAASAADGQFRKIDDVSIVTNSEGQRNWMATDQLVPRTPPWRAFAEVDTARMQPVEVSTQTAEKAAQEQIERQQHYAQNQSIGGPRV